jgi:hypothetical protein
MASIQEKVDSLKQKLSSGTENASGMQTYYLVLAAVPLASFLVSYLFVKPDEKGVRNYKKILMITLIMSLILLPILYFAKINGYLPI